MSAPAWFNYETYLVNKLAQLKTADPEQYGDYTEAELKASMLEPTACISTSSSSATPRT